MIEPPIVEHAFQVWWGSFAINPWKEPSRETEGGSLRDAFLAGYTAASNTRHNHVTEGMVEAALDKWHGDVRWKDIINLADDTDLPDVWRQWMRAALEAAISRAPAQAPAVPEDLRRLSEAATRGDVLLGRAGDPGYSDSVAPCHLWTEKGPGYGLIATTGPWCRPYDDSQRQDAAFLAACWNFVRSLLADAAKNREGGEHG